MKKQLVSNGTMAPLSAHCLDPPIIMPSACVGEGQIPLEVASGANGFVYFVCHYAGGQFTRLPSVQPQHIKIARTIKRILTGKLDSSVSNYPPFNGTEAHFLRAQVWISGNHSAWYHNAPWCCI